MGAAKKIEDYHHVASLRNGFWDDIELPKNGSTKTWWRCALNHRWQATYNTIQQGHWCPECHKDKRLKISDYHDIASLKGYWEGAELPKNNSTKTAWRCFCGYQFFTCYGNIQQGNWCPACAGLVNKTEAEYHQIAKDNGGGWIDSKLPPNVFTTTLWLCSKGHIFPAIYNNIQQGKWCPECSPKKSKPEKELYSRLLPHFPGLQSRVKGKLLLNKRFELDIYSPGLNKAIEYDGPSHYDPKIYGEKVLIKNQDRDSRKNAACLAQGIKLLRIDHRDYLENPDREYLRALAFLQSA